MTTLVTTCAYGCRQPTRSGLLPPFASDACRARWVHDMHLAELATHEPAARQPEPHRGEDTNLSLTTRAPAPLPGSWLSQIRAGWFR